MMMMKMGLVSPGNRRRAPRFNQQVAVRYESEGAVHETLTINVSETGARMVVRGSVGRKFDVTFSTLDGPVRMRAERVWEQPLSGSGRIVGIRFTN